jgi:hypothetical protein
LTLPVSVLAMFILSDTSGFADNDYATRFLKEYPSAAAKLISNFKNAKGNIKFSKQPKEGPARQYFGTFAISHGMNKIEATQIDEKWSKNRLVMCSDGDKEFVLVEKYPNSGEYFIADARRGGTTNGRAEAYDELKGFYSASYALLGWPLVDILKSPGFRILDARPISIDGNNCIKIAYEADGKRLGCKASVCLDPEAGWIIRQASVTKSNGSIYDISVAYSSNSGSEITTSHVIFKCPGIVSDVEFSAWKFEPTPYDEFLIEHYGVSDASWNYEQNVIKPSGNSVKKE